MKKYNIKYSKDAKQDLIDIKRYIKYKLKEPNIADKLTNKISDEINKLSYTSQIYPIIDKDILKNLKIRKIIVDNYIIFYRVKENSVEIIRIMHGRRNWINLL